MDDFLIVLVIALALIVVFGFFFTNAPLPTPKESLTLIDFDVGRVGYSSSVPSREINIGKFTAGLQQEETIRDIPVFDVSANILSADKKTYDVAVDKNVLKSLEKANINFNIKESNLYNNLVVEWNGEKVFDQKAQGIQNIQIPKENISEQNILEIYTSGSWYFWASTLYKIEDFKVKQEYGEARLIPFSISLSEFETLDRGDLKFVVTSKTSLGDLIMKLNGNEIYNQYPSTIGEAKIDDPNLFVIGNNVLSVVAKTGVFELSDVQLNLFSNIKTVTKQKNFDIDQARLDKLKDALVNLVVDVKTVEKQGSLVVELNENRIQLDIKDPGVKTVSFDKSYLKKGENKIIFKSTGNFEINKIKIVQ